MVPTDVSIVVSGKSQLVGVMGWPVEHSLSPQMHNAAFRAHDLPYAYVPFAVEPEHLRDAVLALPALGIRGVNLTIPHKEAALKIVDDLDESANRAGAVNTVVHRDGRLVGYNTDGLGFLRALEAAGFEFSGGRAVILGAGGSARSCAFALVARDMHVTLANRTLERAEALAKALTEWKPNSNTECVVLRSDDSLRRVLGDSVLLVNTTRVGMHPYETEPPPVEQQMLHSGLFVYDLIYNPLETSLLQMARTKGCRTLNGVRMLVEQGAAAFELWTGVEPDTTVMETAVLQGLRGTLSQSSAR